MYDFAGVRFGVADANIESTESKQRLIHFDFIGVNRVGYAIGRDIFTADLQIRFPRKQYFTLLDRIYIYIYVGFVLRE